MNEIPPITDPMGKHWEQPPVSDITLDATHALMDERTFKKLPEYSATMPSGVYDGKCWKRHDGIFDKDCKPEDRKWLLCWYGPCDEPKKCSINHRIILLV